MSNKRKKMFGLGWLTKLVSCLWGLLPHQQSGPDVLVVLDLVQDLDLALPAIKALETRSLIVEVWISKRLADRSPRVLASLGAQNIPFQIVSVGAGELSKIAIPKSVKAMLTISETSLKAHRFAHALSASAKRHGVFVATMQHGYENVGLTYSDSEHPVNAISFMADRIYIWGGMGTLHPHVQDEVRERCVAVGCPKPLPREVADLSEAVPPDATVVGFFENLHWHRYDDEYREAFLDCIVEIAEAYPSLTFLVKPHHAGLWLTTRYLGNRPFAPNLVIIDAQVEPWEKFTAPQILGRLAAVITTPSTVALDSARQRIPTAIFAHKMSLPNYEPLFMLRSKEDLMRFVQESLSPAHKHQHIGSAEAYEARVLIPGNAAGRIADDILQECVGSK